MAGKVTEKANQRVVGKVENRLMLHKPLRNSFYKLDRLLFCLNPAQKDRPNPIILTKVIYMPMHTKNI